jgi:predicted small secreted protein
MTLASNGGSRFTLCKRLYLDRASAPSQHRPVRELETPAALEVKMKKKTLLLLLLLFVLALEGCATMRGLGEDIQNLGRVLKRAAS